MATEQTQLVELPMPQGMNTVIPPFALPNSRAPYILNFLNRDGALVQRGAIPAHGNWTSTSRYVNSMISAKLTPGGASRAYMYNVYTNATSTTYFIPTLKTYGLDFSTNKPAGTTISQSLTSSGNAHTTLIATDLSSTFTSIGSGSSTNMSARPWETWFVEENDRTMTYGLNLHGSSTDRVVVWGGDADNIDATASFTFTNNSVQATYTALSPSSTNLTYAIITDGNNKLYKIESHSVSTSTTGTVQLTRAYRNANNTTSCEVQSVGGVLLSLPLGFTGFTPYSMAAWRGRLFLGGTHGTICWSAAGEFDNFANVLQQYITAYDDQVIALWGATNALYIWTRGQMYKLTGYTENDFTSTYVAAIGCTEPQSLVEVGGVVYFANESGFWGTDGGTPRRVSREIDNLWSQMYYQRTQTGSNFNVGTRVVTGVIRDRWIVVSIHNPFDINPGLMYPLLYDTETQTWTMFGPPPSSSTSIRQIQCMYSIPENDVLLGATARTTVELQDLTQPPPVGQTARTSGNYMCAPNTKDFANSDTGPGSVVFSCVLHTKQWELTPTGTSRVYNLALKHAGQYAATSNATATCLAVNVYRDPNHPMPWMALTDQNTADLSATSKTISYKSTAIGSAGDAMYPRVMTWNRMMDKDYTNFDCSTFSVELTTDSAFVTIPSTNNIFHVLYSIGVQYTPTRQLRVQD